MVGITVAPVFNFIQTSDIWTFLHSTIVSIISEYMKQVNASIWDSSLWKWSRSRLPFHNICKTVLMRMRCFLLVYFTTSSIALFCFFFLPRTFMYVFSELEVIPLFPWSWLTVIFFIIYFNIQAWKLALAIRQYPTKIELYPRKAAWQWTQLFGIKVLKNHKLPTS